MRARSAAGAGRAAGRGCRQIAGLAANRRYLVERQESGARVLVEDGDQATASGDQPGAKDPGFERTVRAVVEERSDTLARLAE